MHALLHRHALLERARVGEPDVLDRHAHHAPRNVHAIFARLQHARQPVKRGIGIARPHRFVQRRNQVVMLFAGLVVKQNFAAQRIGDGLFA